MSRIHFNVVAVVASASRPLADVIADNKFKQTNAYTSTCSHVKCGLETNADGIQTVHVYHHNEEQYGNKHICAYDLHKSEGSVPAGLCGCECYNEGEGLLSEIAAALAGEV